MKPNIVFLDEYTLGGADLGRLQALGEYKGYARKIGRASCRERV